MIEPILISTAFALFAFTSWKKPSWAVYLTILLLPAYQVRFKIAFVPFTFLEGLILILAGATLVRLITNKQLISKTKQLIFDQPMLNFFVLLFLLAGAFSVFTAPVLTKSAGIFKAYFFEAVLFFYLIRIHVNSKKKLKRLFYTFAVLVAYLSVFGIYQFFTLANLPPSWWAVNVASRRITSVVNHPNALALLVGPATALLAVWIATKKSITNHLLLLSAVLLGTVTLILSFSRAGWLAFFAVLFIFGIFTRHRKKILISMLVLVVLILAVPFSRNKLTSLSTGEDLSQENRYVLWSAGIDLIKQQPITGVGLTGFHEEFKNYELGPDKVVQNYPHNFFLNFWVETGVLGLIAITGILVVFYRECFKLWKKNKQLALLFASGMTVIVLHGLVDVPYFKNDLSVLFWIIMALPFLEINNENKTTDSHRLNTD